MELNKLVDQIKIKKSFLCLGLDSDLSKIPQFLLKESDPIFSFNKALIDALSDLIVAVKINTAFYEVNGVEGWNSLKKTIEYINVKYPELFTIADAKRGDIGNTSDKYAKAFFEKLSFNSVTVSPYMGSDSVEPFLKYKNKYTILLGLTSNKGSNDFQSFPSKVDSLFKQVLKKSKLWKGSNNLMYVIGATKSEHLKEIRLIVPDSFLLIPGVGAQGGSLIDTFKNGANQNIGLLINSSRAIIYAGNGNDFLNKSISVAKTYQIEMDKLIKTL
jgi:orotidine-5'-phosphate decarboxylase